MIRKNISLKKLKRFLKSSQLFVLFLIVSFILRPADQTFRINLIVSWVNDFLFLFFYALPCLVAFLDNGLLFLGAYKIKYCLYSK